MNSGNQEILRIYRTKSQAKKNYDRISHFYDFFAGGFESNYRNIGLGKLNINRGETVLEIGFGTGHCLMKIAEAVGETGKACGIDISDGMIEETKKKLIKADLIDRVELICGDSEKIPYPENKFDVVFMSFTLELFDTPDIQVVLTEIMRVLKSKGRLGVVSMSKKGGKSIIFRLYEWAHRKMPNYADCRPIYAEKSIIEAGFVIKEKQKMKICGLPIEIVVGIKS